MSATTQNSAVQSAVNGLLPELYAKSGCEQVGLARESFAAILIEVGEKHTTPATSEKDARTFLLSLRVEELALARACAAGHNHAWELFLTRYREKLYLSALRIARQDAAARELADSLYADLYGTTTRAGERFSKLTSYTGRGSLEGWLRTVLAQEYVNRYRRTKRLVSLEDELLTAALETKPSPSQSQSCGGEERSYQLRLLPQAANGEVKFQMQLLHVHTREVGHFDILQVVPASLIQRAQVRSVAGQCLQMDSLRAFCRQEFANGTPAVNRRPIPDHQQFCARLYEQVLQEDHALRTRQ